MHYVRIYVGVDSFLVKQQGMESPAKEPTAVCLERQTLWLEEGCWFTSPVAKVGMYRMYSRENAGPLELSVGACSCCVILVLQLCA